MGISHLALFNLYNGFELSRPARYLTCFSIFPYQNPGVQIATPAGSAAANGWAASDHQAETPLYIWDLGEAG